MLRLLKTWRTLASDSRPGQCQTYVGVSIEIINNTRESIVIFFTEKKRERVFWGANSSTGCRARRLLAELMLP